MRIQDCFSVDVYLKFNEDFWKDLEKHCLVECCGIDAFDFSKESIEETIPYYNKDEILKNLNLLLHEIKRSNLKYVESNIFNEYSKREIFAERMKRIKKDIL